MNWQWRTVNRRDIHLNVATLGSGPLVLMVHGFPELARSWRHQLRPVAQAGFTAAAMDVRGYGGSAKPRDVEAYAIDELVEDMAAVMDELGDGSAIVVGHDWGAAIAQSACLLAPDRIRGVVSLSAPTLPYSEHRPSDVAGALAGDGFFYQNYFLQPGVAEQELEADVERFLKLFYWGLSGDARDRLLPVRRASGSKLLLGPLEDAGPQMSRWLSDTDFAELVTAFQNGGLTGPLNRYRAQDLDWEILRPHASDLIAAPGLFIAGTLDPVRDLVPGVDLYADPVARFADPRGVHFLEGVGHWTAEEAPADVNRILVPFLTSLK
ncbi:MAG TPA: alpha/beta hydrolase [Streptosporangiaceae bacterium]|jgi:pimeloyl-ACP methyl ester carboxylesterase|nr:alpha/beta hydrolase [Streptosporangiaceae bacterium]